MKYNPFKPGSIVHPGMLSGRIDEIKIIEKLFFQTQHNNSSSFLVTGERGIGKSSLLLYIDCVARGKIPTLNDISMNFLVVNISLEPGDEYETVILKLARQFERVLSENEKAATAVKVIWDFITNWEVMGVKYNKTKDALPANVILEEFSEKVASVLIKTNGIFDGIYFFIDEADKPTKNPHLGTLTKYMSERLQKKGINNFGFGILGLPNITEKIKQSHESALRIFTSIPLKQLTRDESNNVIDLGIKNANKENEIQTVFEEEAKSLVSVFSEGYPHFIQQYSYSAFEADSNNVIETKDVYTGMAGENGALHQLGERYFDNMYFKEIYSKNYRKILGIMAENTEEYITKSQLLEKSKISETTLTNAINVLLKKGTIIKKKGSRGSYKMCSKSFAAWIITLNATDKETSEGKKI